MAGLVNIVSGDTLHTSSIVQVMKMSEKDAKAYGIAIARRESRTGERKRATMLPSFSDESTKSFCCIEGGKMGSGPRGTEQGDLIYIIRDARLPCLLCQVPGHSNMFYFLGEIFVERFAAGEVLQNSLPHWKVMHLV